MFQDRRGYLWIGSSGGGICRYDGKNYFIYTRKNGLCSDDVNCIAEDMDGAVWFGTATGISKFIDGRFISFPEEVELMKSSVFAIVTDAEKNLWFGTSIGAFKYANEKFTKYAEKQGLTKAFIRCILPDSNGKLWFGTVNGKIFSFENEKFSEVHLITKAKDNFISAEKLDGSENVGESARISENLIWSMYEDSKGNFWIGVDDGLWKGTIQNEKWRMEKTELTGNSFLSICEDKKGNLWFGTGETGVWMFDGKEFVNFNENDGLASNLVYSIIEDQEGNMWFGGYGTGVSKLNLLSYEIYNKKNIFPQSFVWTVKEDPSGNIWAGFYQPGISEILNPRDIVKKEILNFSTEGLVYNIWFENETILWASTVNGIEIFHYDKIKKSLKQIRKIDKKDGLPGNIIRSVYKDKQNNLWIATAFGIAVMKGKNHSDYRVEKIFTDKDGLVNNYVFSMLEDNEGNMWFATAGGVSKFDGKTFRNYTSVTDQNDTAKNKPLLDKVMLLVSAVSEGLANQDVRSIAMDNERQLWFATGSGISWYDEKNDTFKSITSNEGLSVDRLYFLQYDSLRNLLWVGTAFGLDKFDLGEFKRSGKILISHPTTYDGFIEVETNTNAVCIDKSSNLWLGTIDGLIKYYPDYIRPKNEVEAQTQITKISINRNDTLLSENSSLPYEMNNITLDFIGISLSAPERVEYKYQLEGFDNDWTISQKETSAKYSNLPSGNYIFKIVASNNDGLWNKKPVIFPFAILPPWWQTWWFRVLFLIVLIISIWLLIKWREKNLVIEKINLEEKVKQRTQQLHEQKEMVEEKNKEITDSILYAKRIQTALLASEKYLQQNLPEHFIFFKPRDIVSGDFYWSFKTSDNFMLFTLADCTGHGVPGAFMSMIGINKLNEIVSQKKIHQPDKILNALREEIIFALNPDEKGGQKNENSLEVKDGMDAALVKFQIFPDSNRDKFWIEYAGANNPIWIARKNEKKLFEIAPDIFPVGKHYRDIKPFTLQKIALEKDDCLYLFSDGYADQFGGPKGKKFKYSQFKELLLSVCHFPMDEQKKIISSSFENWKGSLNQVDDVCVVGIRV